MSRCKDCEYMSEVCYRFDNEEYNLSTCKLSYKTTSPNKDNDCQWFNKHFYDEDICYNCNYYRGGSDWGLFCAHKEKYHHLGQFNDKPCEYYEKKKKDGSTDGD